MWIEYLKAGGVREFLYQIRKDWMFSSYPESTNKNIALCYMDQGNYKKALEILGEK